MGFVAINVEMAGHGEKASVAVPVYGELFSTGSSYGSWIKILQE